MTEEIGTSNLLRTWANDGTVVVPANAKIDEGWLRGEQPPHEWMNYIHNALGQKINHALSRGVADWNADTLYLVGSLVRHDGRVWMSFVENSNSGPSSANSDWSVVQDERSTVVTEDILVEVGSGGDFATISDAIAELSKMQRGWSQDLKSAEIRLRAGFVMEETIAVIGVDLLWMTITGVDAETTIARDALVETTAVPGQYPAFSCDLGGRLPQIGQRFVMDTSGSASNGSGIVMSSGELIVLPGCGVIDAAQYGLLQFGGYALAEEAMFDGAGDDGIRMSRIATAALRAVSSKDCGGRGIRMFRGTTADATSADFSGAGSRGADVSGGKLVIADANCRKGSEDSSDDITVTDGGSILADGSAGPAIGGTNVTPNEITSNGIIFK